MRQTLFVILYLAICLEMSNAHGMHFHFKKKKDARARKSRGYFFVRHRESVQVKMPVSEFCKVKVVLTHLN